LPALRKAEKAVENVDKKSIDEMKSFIRPPELVGVVMNSVLWLF